MLRLKREMEFKKTEVGKIPREWDESRLGEFIDLKSGNYFQFSEFTGFGIRCLKIDNVSFGEISWDTVSFLPEEYLNKFSDLVLKEGDIVIALNRPIINGQLKVGRIRKMDCPSLLYQRVGKIAFRKEGLHHDFLFYVFLCEYFKQQLLSSLAGTDQPYIRTPIFLDIKVPIPPFEEQKRIGSMLLWFDELIENKKRQNEVLEKTAMAIFKSWFMDFEPFKDGEFVLSELGEIPKDWKAGRLIDISEIIMGQSPPSRYYNEDGEGLPFIQGKGQFGKYTPETTTFCSSEGKIAKPLDIIVTVRAPVGELNIADRDYIIGRGAASLRSKHWSFLFCWLRQNSELMKAYERGTTFEAITKQELDNFPMLLPPTSILEKFNSITEPLLQKILLNQKQITILRGIRDTLLPLLVFGRLRVEEI